MKELLTPVIWMPYSFPAETHNGVLIGLKDLPISKPSTANEVRSLWETLWNYSSIVSIVYRNDLICSLHCIHINLVRMFAKKNILLTVSADAHCNVLLTLKGLCPCTFAATFELLFHILCKYRKEMRFTCFIDTRNSVQRFGKLMSLLHCRNV